MEIVELLNSKGEILNLEWLTLNKKPNKDKVDYVKMGNLLAQLNLLRNLKDEVGK